MAETHPDASAAYWLFEPSLGLSFLALTLFSLTTLLHIGQAIYYWKPYCWIIVVSSVLQVVTYAFRTISIQNQTEFTPYAVWFITILVAPLWTNAFVYMVFGRMVWNYALDRRVWKVKAWHFGYIFVSLDVLAFAVQIWGAVTAAANHAPRDQVLKGLHIYMIGLGAQLVCIFAFCVVAMRLYAEASDNKYTQLYRSDRRDCILLSYTQFGVLALIVLRIAFRMIEYSQGLDSLIPVHEGFQYCLDSLPMWMALVAFNVVHPGLIMRGRAMDLPSRRERRRMEKRGEENMPEWASMPSPMPSPMPAHFPPQMPSMPSLTNIGTAL